MTKFLDGDWAKRTKLFRLAVAPSLNDTKLADEIETQRARLQAAGITFEPLDQDKLSLMLKEHPKLVDDFFGRSWVEAFNGAEAAQALSRRKLSREQKVAARRFIRELYTAHFQAVDGGIPATAPVFRGAVKRVPVFDRYVEPTVQLVESIVSQEAASNTPAKQEGGPAATTPAGFRRHDVRTKLSLSAALAEGDRIVLLGRAGFGKSAALRVLIHTLLGEEARFPALAKTWGQRLPLLVPFGFLTRHFSTSDAPTIESALVAWIKVLGAKDDGLTLLREMLEDDRLLLLVDGLDEWQNREAALAALTALTSYVQTRGLPIVATARPLGFGRISNFGSEWKRAELESLTLPQQRELAEYWFRHFHEANGVGDASRLADVLTRDGDDFARELAESPVRAELAGIPLLLSVLVFLRLSGRVLPRSRLAALEELIKALLEDQPSRRAQSAMQSVDQAENRSPRIRRGLEYLAFCIHKEPNSLVLPNERAAALLWQFYRDKLELTASEADDLSARVIELGQTELGILVAPLENHVGVLHRIFQEYLAARYLSRVPFPEAQKYCVERGRKGQWHEVTLILLQLQARPSDADQLVDELAKPTGEPMDEPVQQILLARIAAADTSCSRRKATELAERAFQWIECGRWMPLRLSLVREIAAGLESEQIGPLVSSRTRRWFPGRQKWLHDIPAAVLKHPSPETISDLRIAFYNADSSYDFRKLAKALAACAPKAPKLADEFLGVLRSASEPELMASALHALATGWPDHPTLPELLQAASVSPSDELKYVGILTRFRRGERTNEIRDALFKFCRDGHWAYPWENEMIDALVTGWPREPDLKRKAIERVGGFGYPGTWATKPAIAYLLRAYPGDDEVARLIACELANDRKTYRPFNISDVHEPLLAGFKNHPLLAGPAEAWLASAENTRHSPMEVAVVAQLGGTVICRQALLDYLRRGDGLPAWIISTLEEMVGPADPEFRAVLTGYISNERRRSDAVRWLHLVVTDPKELGIMLRSVLAGNDVIDSHHALSTLVGLEGVEGPGIWTEVERQLENDEHGHYWRLGHRILIKYWPQHPRIRGLVLKSVYKEDISIDALYEVYGADPQIRPLLDATLRVLHEDLRTELVRAAEPLARRGVAPAIDLVAGFCDEPNAEARTVAARATARATVRTGKGIAELTQTLATDLSVRLFILDEQKQAAIVGLLELGRADLVIQQREDGRPLELSTYSGASHNWDYVAAIVENWETLAELAPDIWSRVKHSPVIATELAKAGKGAAAHNELASFELAVREGKQLEIEHVRALIALHGRSTLLRDLFVARLQWFVSGHPTSMMEIESAAYHAMGTYVADHFHGDPALLPALRAVAGSTMISEVGLTALCRGWPEAPEIAGAITLLPQLLNGPEPLTAWLFSTRADSALMAKYVLGYPGKVRGDRFGETRQGLTVIRTRLQTDRTCRELILGELKGISDPAISVPLARLIAPVMQDEPEFRDWVAQRLGAARAAGQPIAPVAFDGLANRCKAIEHAFLEAVLTRESRS
ncbi:NACHT domain-containing protein [Termitidicoccus mucosus]|uniref:NACHT domain-containing protein n=1 Tax=Termitidicoccus mucosus TaxID=1184151 RepID=UPI0011AB869C